MPGGAEGAAEADLSGRARGRLHQHRDGRGRTSQVYKHCETQGRVV